MTISTAVIAQVARAARPTFAALILTLTVWAMPGIKQGNDDVAARVAIAVTR
jgi:hypothetical protein